MGLFRAPENPLIRPEDIEPSRRDFEVIGVFNAGVARYREEVILLLRVAERPVGGDTDAVLCPIYDIDTNEIVSKPFARDDPRNDFSDPRLVVVAPCRGHPPIGSRAGSARDSRAGRGPERDVLRWGAPHARHDRPWTSPAPGGQGQDGLGKGERGQDGLGTVETYLTSISHLRLARSRDGIHFQIAKAPTIHAADRYETFGIEDPRITCIDGTFYIAYVGVSPLGVTTCLAATRDFESFERRGVIFHPDNKDVVIFPERVGGRHYALHRPHSSLFLRNDIWLAESPDLLCWGRHRHLLGTRQGLWDETRIGASAVPFRIEEGWLEVYHGADRDNRYGMGAVLLDGERPWQVLARCERPLFEPEAEYEQAGFFGNVVFSCGLLFEDQKLKIYYGAADTSICYAEIPLADVHENLNL